MKRKILLVTVILGVLLTTPLISSAVDVIDLDCWYSDASKMGYWNKDSLDILATTNGEGMDGNDLINYVETAFSRWDDATGNIGIDFIRSKTDADVVIAGFDRDTFNDNDIDPGVIALGIPTERTFLIKGYYDRNEYNLYKNTEGTLYFCWDSTSENYSSSTWKKIFTHEMGHIFGFDGHMNRSNLSSVMHSILEDCASYPSSYDEAHFKNLY